MSHLLRTGPAVLSITLVALGCDRAPALVGELPIVDTQPITLRLVLSNESSSPSVETHLWIDGVEILAGPLDAGNMQAAPRPHHEYELAADRGAHVVDVEVDGRRLTLSRELEVEADTWLILGVWDADEAAESGTEHAEDGSRSIHREPGLTLTVQESAPAFL